MLKRVKKIIICFFAAMFGIIKIVFQAIIPIWHFFTKGNINVWFAIFHQPLLVLITSALLSGQIENAILYNDTRILMIILIAFESLTLTFAENAIIELCYHLRRKSKSYETLQKLQQYFNNYALILISLGALCFAAFHANSEVANQLLLAFGILYFIITICSDAYRIFIFEKGTIKELAMQIKDMWVDN